MQRTMTCPLLLQYLQTSRPPCIYPLERSQYFEDLETFIFTALQPSELSILKVYITISL